MFLNVVLLKYKSRLSRAWSVALSAAAVAYPLRAVTSLSNFLTAVKERCIINCVTVFAQKEETGTDGSGRAVEKVTTHVPPPP